jgi:hypothetical protein
MNRRITVVDRAFFDIEHALKEPKQQAKASADTCGLGNSSGDETNRFSDGRCLMKSASKHTTSVNWKTAQQKAALTAKWAVTMTKVRIR